MESTRDDLGVLEYNKDGDNYYFTREELIAYIAQQIAKAEREAIEIFIPVRGYEGLYEISNLGNIRSIKGGRRKGTILKQLPRGTGGVYWGVSLCKDGKVLSRSVHRLVAEAFLSNPDNKRTVNHKDSDGHNNTLDNLEWATHSENERHSHKNGKTVWNKGRFGIPANKPRIAELKSQEKE